MGEKEVFPKWFLNTFIAIGVFSLIQEFDKSSNFIFNLIFGLSYPVLWLIFLFLLKGKVTFGRGKYLLNISMSIVGFFAIIFIAQYRFYVEFIGKVLGGNFSILTDYQNTDYDEFGRPHAPDLIISKNGSDLYYYAAYAIYLLFLAYFIGASWFLSRKAKILNDKIKLEEQERLQQFLNKLRNS